MGGLFWRSKEVTVSFGKKKKNFVVRCVPFWYEGYGLMFKSKEKARSLMFGYNFSTKMSIFSLCIPFDFLAIWLDEKNNLIELKIVKPKEKGIKPHKKFRRLIEIPITEKHKDLTNFILKNDKRKIFFSIK